MSRAAAIPATVLRGNLVGGRPPPQRAPTAAYPRGKHTAHGGCRRHRREHYDGSVPTIVAQIALCRGPCDDREGDKKSFGNATPPIFATLRRGNVTFVYLLSLCVRVMTSRVLKAHIAVDGGGVVSRAAAVPATVI